MQKPTSTDIRGWSEVDWAKLGKGEPVSPDPDPLDIEIDRAIAYIHKTIGQTYEDITDSDLSIIFAEATQLRVEQQVYQRQKGYLSDLHNDAVDLSVEGYSTKRISSKERTPTNMVNPHPRLNECLWELMTDDKKNEWKLLLGITGVDAAIVIDYPWW